MALYSLHAACGACPQVHPLGVRLSLRPGLAERGSVDEIYGRHGVPAQIVTVVEEAYTCPNTGKRYRQPDLNKVFLVKVA